MNRRVPEAVIRRLPRYYAKLGELETQGVIRISSMQLSQKIGFNASQIRQDLNYFGGFGQQGYGYMVDSLRENIGEILGLYIGKKMVVIGCGNIGAALAKYNNFVKYGFEIVRMFDKDSELEGKSINGIPIQDIDSLSDFLESNQIDIGIIAVPAGQAQKIADILVANNIKGIWNFAPVDIIAQDVVIEDVRLSDSLFALNYKILNEIYD